MTRGAPPRSRMTPPSTAETSSPKVAGRNSLTTELSVGAEREHERRGRDRGRIRRLLRLGNGEENAGRLAVAHVEAMIGQINLYALVGAQADYQLILAFDH